MVINPPNASNLAQEGQIGERSAIASATPLFSLNNISVTYHLKGGGTYLPLEDMSLTIERGELLTVIGPSGCGKTTLLRVIAGLESPSAGSVISNRPTRENKSDIVTSQESETVTGRRSVGIVFQEPALLPWLNVEDNIALPLKLRGIGKEERKTRVDSLIELLNLQGFEAMLPRELSGGMAQRVAIGRALAMDAELLLLDEPFAALDALLREQMAEEFEKLWNRLDLTGCLVTHSIREAVLLGSRVAVMSRAKKGVRAIVDVDLERPRRISGDMASEIIALELKCKELLSEG